MRVEPRFARAAFVALLAPARDGDQVDSLAPRVLANALGHFVAVGVRHADVEQRDARLKLLDGAERRLPVEYGVHLVPRVPQEKCKALGSILVVVGDEDAERLARGPGLRDRRDAGRRAGDDGQLQDELTAVADAFAARLDRPAVELDELADQRETDAQT